MPLTNAAIKQAKANSRPHKLFDGKGLFLSVEVSGGKLWRFKYRYGGKEKKLALGNYPETSLKEARERRDEARKLLADGTDPGAQRKIERLARLPVGQTLLLPLRRNTSQRGSARGSRRSHSRRRGGC